MKSLVNFINENVSVTPASKTYLRKINRKLPFKVKIEGNTETYDIVKATIDDYFDYGQSEIPGGYLFFTNRDINVNGVYPEKFVFSIDREEFEELFKSGRTVGWCIDEEEDKCDYLGISLV